MKRLTNKKAADAQQCKACGGWFSSTSDTELCGTCERALKRLNGYAAPVVHGQWIGEGDGYADGEIVTDVWYCSECDYCIDDGTDRPDMLPKFCPNCGAKMDEEDKHDSAALY